MPRMLITLFALPLIVIVLVCGYAAVSVPVGSGLAAVSNLRFQALWYALFSYTALVVLALPAPSRCLVARLALVVACHAFRWNHWHAGPCAGIPAHPAR
jgi:hypothetical protein